MKIPTEDIRTKIAEKGLKVTPQRVIILEAICKLGNHPSAENIIDYIQKNYPSIAVGTVYKVLDTFVENRLIKRVHTAAGVMRYDGNTKKHHHLYSSDSGIIEDYEDKELDQLLENYFANKKINDFNIEEVVLQIKISANKE